MKIVAISDTHNRHKKLVIPPCDILITVGDYTSMGYEREVKDYHKWLNLQPARYKITVQGNHELKVRDNFYHMKMIAQQECPNVIFVEHELVEIEGIKIFCSAWTPEFYNWAYNAARTLEAAQQMQIPYIKDKWDQIPLDIDVLAVHGPISGIHDAVYRVDGVTISERVGCWHLGEKVIQLPKLKHFISGHLHSNNNVNSPYQFKGINFHCVCICDEQYYPSYEPTVIEL